MTKWRQAVQGHEGLAREALLGLPHERVILHFVPEGRGRA